METFYKCMKMCKNRTGFQTYFQESGQMLPLQGSTDPVPTFPTGPAVLESNSALQNQDFGHSNKTHPLLSPFSHQQSYFSLCDRMQSILHHFFVCFCSSSHVSDPSFASQPQELLLVYNSSQRSLSYWNKLSKLQLHWGPWPSLPFRKDICYEDRSCQFTQVRK